MPRVLYDLGYSRRQAVQREVTQTLNVADAKASVLDCAPILLPSPFARDVKACACDKNNKVRWLRQKDFSRHRSNGIILRVPGVYKFAENIVFSPTIERTTAISVVGSNITLDFGGNILSQGNALPLIYGVGVARGVKNFLLTGRDKEAQILDFTLAGIRVFGNTDTITVENITVAQSVPQQLTNDQIPVECKDIICLRLNYGICIGEGDTGSIVFAGTSRANLVKNVILRNSTIKGSTIGVQMIFTCEITVSDCLVIENTYYGALFGTSWVVLNDAGTEVLFPLVWNGVVQRSRFDKNKGLNFDLANPADLFVFDFLSGLSFYGAQTFEVDSCTTHENFNNGFILAVDHDGSHSMTWSNHSSKRNQSTLEICDGWHHSGSVANTIGPCLGQAFPFATNQNLVLRNSVSCENLGISSCNGFRFAFPLGVSVTNCVAMGNISEGLASGFRAQGGLPGGEGKDIVFDGCVSQRNNGGPGQPVAGFILHEVLSNVVMRGCVAQNNATTDVAASLAGGVVITARAGAGVDNVTIENCTITANGHPSAVFGLAGGIVVFGTDPTLAVTNLLVQNNTIAFNNGKGYVHTGVVSGVILRGNKFDLNKDIGVDISGTPSPTLVMTNVAYNNTGANYAGVPPAVIISTTTSTLPNQVGAQNLDILP